MPRLTDTSPITRRDALKRAAIGASGLLVAGSGSVAARSETAGNSPVGGGRGLITSVGAEKINEGDPFWLSLIPDGEDEPADPVEVSCGNESPRTRQPHTLIQREADGTFISWHDVVLLPPNQSLSDGALPQDPPYEVVALNPCSNPNYSKFVFRPRTRVR